MAKDGTYRGGRRVRAGDKPDPLVDKISAGAAARILNADDFDTDFEAEDFSDGVELQGEEIPKPSEYLSSLQKSGETLGADKIFEETWVWLQKRKCDKFVNPRLVESYAQAFARYIQCEEAISKFGFLGKHPTTGAAIANPFVQMSISFQKQANLLWYEIFDIVKQNCTTDFSDTPQDNTMELLLTARRKNDRQHNLGFNGGFANRYSPKHTEKYMVFLCLAHRRYFVVHSRFHIRHLWQSAS